MFTVEFPLPGGGSLLLPWPLVVLLGGAIGFLTGLFGVGGGFLLTPCLNILFGVPFPNAVGSDLAQIFVTGTTSASRHYRRGNVDIKLGTIMAVGAGIGTLVGKEIMKLMEESAGDIILYGKNLPALPLIMKGLFLLLMAAVMVSVLLEAGKRPAGDVGDGEGAKSSESENPAATDESPAPEKDEDDAVSTGLSRWMHSLCLPPVLAFPRSGIEQLSFWVPLLLSFCVGIITGLMGVGGGFVLFPLLVYVLGVPTTIAVGTSAFQIVFATFIGTISYALDEKIWWALVGMLLVGSLVGVQIGVHASGRFGGRRIRKYFGFVIGLGILVIVGSLVHTIFFKNAAG